MALLVEGGPSARPRAEGEGPFLRHLDRAREEVNERIACLLRSSLGGAPAALEGHLLHGKRLRGGTALMLYGLLDEGRGDRSLVLDLAAAVELSHAVSLILDDMLDGDEERREGPALHAVLGRPRAMLEVVGLLALPYSLASADGRPFAAPLARSHARLVEGARTEFDPPRGLARREAYEELIASKTGELFALAARFGAAAAGACRQAIDRAEEYGRRTGMAVQIADDLADLDRERGGLPGRSEAVLVACLEEGRGPAEARVVLGEGIEEARRAARALLEVLDRPPPLWASCLLSAPAEMAGMMLR